MFERVFSRCCGLADEILYDVGSEPAALPLVAFCLEALYRSCVSTRHLSLKAYLLRSGPVGRRYSAADCRTPLSLQKSEGFNLEATLPKLFRLLVHVDAAGTVSRRRACRGELTAEPLLERIVEPLVQGRLLLADDLSQATVSLAHEVLLTAWPELGSWVQAHQAQLQRLDRALSSLQSADPLDRSYAAQALGEIGPVVPEVISGLITALGDADHDVRGNAHPSLAKIGPPAASALIAALGNANATVREGAAWALAGSEPPPADAVWALIKALGDGCASVRIAVASALRGSGRKRRRRYLR